MAEINDVIAIIDRHHGRWYNVVYDEAIERTRLAAAEQLAKAELQKVFTHMGKP